MIISHKYKFIFVKTARVAGNSVEQWLEPQLGPEDRRIRGGNHEVPAGALYFHAPASLVKKNVGLGIWDGYLVWSIVRHPCDRLISAYYRRIHKNQEKWSDFKTWLRDAPKGHLTHKILDEDIDFYVKYENLMVELEVLARKVGLEPPKELAQIGSKFRKDRRPWHEFFDAEALQIFHEKYPKEVEFHKKLGYKI